MLWWTTLWLLHKLQHNYYPTKFKNLKGYHRSVPFEIRFLILYSNDNFMYYPQD